MRQRRVFFVHQETSTAAGLPRTSGSRLPQSMSLSLNVSLAGGLAGGKPTACRSSNSSSPKSPSSRNRCCARCCITCIFSIRRRNTSRKRPRRHAQGLARYPASSWPMILTRRSKPLPIIAHEGAARCSCAAVVSGQQHQLSAKALACIQDAANTIFVSPATLWEIGIKDSLGKLSPSTSSFPTVWMPPTS